MKPTLVIHGGAIFGPEDYDKNIESKYREVLQRSLQQGSDILSKKGTALDAIEQSIHILEECGLFDAGRGAVYTADGKQELDASIMDGSTLKAGAVAGVHKIKRPISAARKVMEKTWHVLLIGKGAEEFADQQNLEMVDPSYFHNEERWQTHLKLKTEKDNTNAKKHSTVGAVALDGYGNLAAGTSTGGLEMKYFGRVGDSPIIGAGTYANNETCAISCTGQGEYFIRTAAAYDVHALMSYKKYSLEQAMNEVLHKIKNMGAIGGMIGVDKDGNIALPYTSEYGMFRGYFQENEIIVKIEQ